MKGGGLTFIQTKDAEPGGGEENEFCGRGLRGRIDIRIDTDIHNFYLYRNT